MASKVDQGKLGGSTDSIPRLKGGGALPGIITAGHVNVTRQQLRCPIQLAGLLSGMMDRRYAGRVGEPGWGSTTDDTTRLGQRHLTRPHGGEPVIVDTGSRFPLRLEARLYFDKPDDRLIRQLDQSVDPRITHQLQAIDVIITQVAEGNFDVLISTQDGRDILGVALPVISDLATSTSGAPAKLSATPEVVTSDTYLWIIERANRSPKLNTNFEVQRVRSVVTEDTLYRRTRYHEEASLDRLELLAAICKPTSKYGPAKLNVFDRGLGVAADIELRPNGGYSVFIGSSYYSERHVEREKLGRHLVLDTAYSFIPQIKQAYVEDSDWNLTRRSALMSEARDLLRDVAPMAASVLAAIDPGPSLTDDGGLFDVQR